MGVMIQWATKRIAKGRSTLNKFEAREYVFLQPRWGQEGDPPIQLQNCRKGGRSLFFLNGKKQSAGEEKPY